MTQSDPFSDSLVAAEELCRSGAEKSVVSILNRNRVGNEDYSLVIRCNAPHT